ncbi:hypothetical protein ACFQY0_18430 [Haloferula chungangensis]|uniref:DUF3108 domain-containing protein n=1 Tax=Haloferula chungangensis TaxID=1048331 RepID=A0ABW2L9W3_9BACT
MSTPLFLSSFFAGIVCAASLPALASESVLLKEPDPKLGLEISSSTAAEGGVAETSSSAGHTTQSISITRERLIRRTMRPDGIGGVVSYHILRDAIHTSINGTSTSKTGDLEGKTATAGKNGAGNWSFSLPEASVYGEAAKDLEMLGAFENRKWLPGRKVAIGETWNFNPTFIRRALQRDVPNPQVIGIMKLRKVDKAPDGSDQAIIDCFIRGGGEKTMSDGSVADAETGLAGTLTVNLDQPGRMRLYLSGRLNTGTVKGGETARAIVPLNMSVKINPLPLAPPTP